MKLNILAFAFVLTLATNSSAQNYTVVDLGTLGGSSSYATALNNIGQVVGYSYTGSGYYHAFLYQNDTMQDLGTASGISSEAFAINDNSQIVGGFYTSDGLGHAFLFSGGVMQDLGITMNNVRASAAFGINNGGQIVGSANIDNYSHAYLYSNGSLQYISFLPGGYMNAANGINNIGQVVGYSTTTNNPFGVTIDHAFLFSNGSIQDLGTLGGSTSVGTAINNSGKVVGYAYPTNISEPRAFLSANGSMQNIAAGVNNSGWSEAWAINDSGQIVGIYATNGFNVTHAFLYSGGLLQDLNTLLINPNSGWTLIQANGINNAGQIVGYGASPSGQTHAFLLNPVPVGTIIITQPQSQTAQAGSNITFTVTATGTPPLTYQWCKSGVNISDATNAALTLNSVTAANSGGYSVVVSNPYGSVTSATASLAVLTEGSNGNKPVPITATPSWSKPSTVKNLVFITHGWQPVEANPLGPPAQPWMAAMTNAIAQQLGGDNTWQFETYDWTWASWTLEPQQALSQAQYIGTQLGKAIAGMGYQQVHLIAHSAGSGMIQAIADQLRAAPNPPQIQLTFLDPYIGIFHQEQNNYGKNADWSDCYFVEDGTGGFTGSYLNLAFNVDVSWVDPAYTAWPYIGLGGGKVALSSHGYPIDFYLGSITGGNSPCSSAYGFALSEEMEGVFWFNNQANYPVGTGPFLPCSPADAVKNPIPGIAGLESGAAGAWAVITDIPHALSQAGATLIGNAGAELQSIWSALPLVKSGGIQPADNTANTPAWLALGLTVTNAVNFVQFDAGFTDTNTAQGLLTVYWNTNQVGMVDERVAQTNLQTYRFLLPGTVSSGLYTLSFRLDSFANSSTVAVTNVTTGFVGMTQPTTLRLSITNRAPLVQLTAATNFTYLIQSSTNLVDWTPTAMLLNTNGTVQFTDSAVTNSKARFYRAVVQ